MGALHPIMWTEGTFLTQQHFQYWETWLLEQHNRASHLLFCGAYGLVNCELDDEGLKRQECIIKSLVWRSTKGSWISHDHVNMPLLSIRLEDRSEQTVYMNFPKNNLCAGLSGYDTGNDLAAYQANYSEWGDRYDQVRRQEISLGVAQVKLSLQPGEAQIYESWPLVRIKRSAHTQYIIDNDFIPNCLTVKGSPQLQSQIQLIIARLSERMALLRESVKRTRDILLAQEYQIISHALFDLNEMLRLSFAQPKEVYYLLSKTLSSLSLLRFEDSQPEAYHHDQMGDLIVRVISRLSDFLNQAVESLQTYQMSKNAKAFHCLDEIKTEHLQGHSWYLGLDYSHQPPDQIQKYISQAKLGTKQSLEQMIASALPGIPLISLMRPPNKINPQEGYEYFKIDHESLFWKHVKEERNLMLYLPSHLSGNKITLDIVKD